MFLYLIIPYICKFYVQISEDSLTFLRIFPNVPAFLEFRLEVSFCISSSLMYLKLKRDV